jgi:hypothetical protein
MKNRIYAQMHLALFANSRGLSAKERIRSMPRGASVLEPVGLIASRDATVQPLVAGAYADKAGVIGQVMTSDVFSAGLDTPLVDLVRQMEAKNFPIFLSLTARENWPAWSSIRTCWRRCTNALRCQ